MKREHITILSESLEITGDLITARMDAEREVQIGWDGGTCPRCHGAGCKLCGGSGEDPWNKNFTFGQQHTTKVRLTIVMDLDPATAKVWAGRHARPARPRVLPHFARQAEGIVAMLRRADDLMAIRAPRLLVEAALGKVPPSHQLPWPWR